MKLAEHSCPSPVVIRRTVGAGVAALLLALSLGAGETHEVSTSAQLYLDTCAPCHSIGGGELTGPDLLPSTQWPEDDLKVAIKRMEENTGPMTDEQIDDLADFLRSSDRDAVLAAAEGKLMAETTSGLEPASSDVGRKLFFGDQAFANGAAPCFTCHAAGSRGGSLAVDLTAVHTRMGEPALISATVQPSFPMMRSTYGLRPVTPQEAVHLAAFFKESAVAATTGGLPPQSQNSGSLYTGATGFVAVIFGAVAIIVSRRREGVRARLARGSFRR